MIKQIQKFDIVTALLTLAGRIQKRRHTKALAKADAMKATIAALEAAAAKARDEHCKAIAAHIEADWDHRDIEQIEGRRIRKS